TIATIATKTVNGATAVVNIDHTTIVASSVQGYRDVGIQSHNKTGVTDGTIIYNVTNSIIDATDPVDVQPPYIESDIHIDYSDVFGEWWPGTGNLDADPMFVDPANHDYRLQATSPCIDAGDPAAEPDPDLTITDQGYSWSGGGSHETPEGSLTEDTIWTAQEGPYRVTGELTIPSGMILTILPGTTVFFDPDARMVVRGRLIAEGVEYEPIRFTRMPGNGTWGGIQFVNTFDDNSISHAVIEYGRTNDGMIGLQKSNLLLDSVTMDNTIRARIRTVDSSLIVRNCVFTDTCDAGQAPTDNQSEHIVGRGVAPDGWLIIENNVFGLTPGHNDAIDFDGPSRPNPIPQIMNNVFMGGGDDALDIGSDAHIEGNLFMNYTKDQYNRASGESNGISAGAGRDFLMVRNIFHNVQHIAQVKDDSFLTFVNNTAGTVSGAAIYLELGLPGRGPGQGAYVDGCIFHDAPLVFEGIVETTDFSVNRCIIPSEWHNLGVGNIDADPLFVDPDADFRLKTGSPAIGAGPCGLDMGAFVPGGAAVCGEPGETTYRTDATLTVGGPGITHYRYSVSDPAGPWSEERPVDVPIRLTNLFNGRSYIVYVVGRNSAGIWQSEDNPTSSHPWTIDTSYSTLVINEVLAINSSAVEHEGTLPDLIELYYDGPASLSLAGFSISDNQDNPAKFIFPPGTAIEPGEYLVLYADSDTTTTGIHLGFNLDGDGEGLYLYNNSGVLLDSVEFGLQLPDLSIGRTG
ncbi:MAG: lamin tail domain-containing protein, partial [Planctomycetota bacterium]